MKWARIENDTVIEVTEIDPAGRFVPTIVWHVVPDATEPNSQLVNGEWVHPPTERIEPASVEVATEMPAADAEQPAAA